VLYLSTPVPAVFFYSCTQCDAMSSVIVHPSRKGLRMAVLPVHSDTGIASANTPKSVAFDLGQAARCREVDAHSAAMAMWRAALECLLEGEGFTEKSLRAKLAAFDKALKQGTAPGWASEIAPEYLQVIRELGQNAATADHGDAAGQEGLSERLYRKAELTFLELLEAVYERPERGARRLAELRSAEERTHI